MNLDPRLLEEIIRRVLTVTQPAKIIIFGSAAADRMTRDSDVDLLILETSPVEVREEGRRISSALRGLGYPFDIIIMNYQYFEESKGVIGGLAYPAYKYGKVIYEAA